MKRRVDTAGTDVEALLGGDPPNTKEAWRRMKGWYKAAVNRAPPPARATLEPITAERVDLYSYILSPEYNIPFTVTLADIDDSVPMEDEIADAVKKLRRNMLGGPLRMRAENLKGLSRHPTEEIWRRIRERRKRRRRRKAGTFGENWWSS